jgi:hypothetical protein
VSNLTALLNGRIAAATVAWRAAWDKTSQTAYLICRATVLADYAKIYKLIIIIFMISSIPVDPRVTPSPLIRLFYTQIFRLISVENQSEPRLLSPFLALYHDCE